MATVHQPSVSIKTENVESTDVQCDMLNTGLDISIPEFDSIAVTAKTEKIEVDTLTNDGAQRLPHELQQLVVADVHRSSSGKLQISGTKPVQEIEDAGRKIKLEMTDHVTDLEMKGITKGNLAEELQVHIPVVKGSVLAEKAMVYKPRMRDPTRQTVTVTKQVDKSKIGTPVPEDEQLPGYYYCNKCWKKFKDVGYFRIHMKRLCKAVESKELMKCQFCEKGFGHSKTYREHLFTHDGIKRFNCKRCGEHFSKQKFLDEHRRDCLQRSR